LATNEWINQSVQRMVLQDYMQACKVAMFTAVVRKHRFAGSHLGLQVTLQQLMDEYAWNYTQKYYADGMHSVH